MDGLDQNEMTRKWHQLLYFRERLAKPPVGENRYHRRDRAYLERQVERLEGELAGYELVNYEWVPAS